MVSGKGVKISKLFVAVSQFRYECVYNIHVDLVLTRLCRTPGVK